MAVGFRTGLGGPVVVVVPIPQSYRPESGRYCGENSTRRRPRRLPKTFSRQLTQQIASDPDNRGSPATGRRTARL